MHEINEITYFLPPYCRQYFIRRSVSIVKPKAESIIGLNRKKTKGRVRCPIKTDTFTISRHDSLKECRLLNGKLHIISTILESLSIAVGAFSHFLRTIVEDINVVRQSRGVLGSLNNDASCYVVVRMPVGRNNLQHLCLKPR